MCSHKVAGNHGTQGNDVVVSTAVAHYADGFHRQEYGKGLAGQVVPRCAVFIGSIAQFLNENIVCLTEQVGVFFLHFAQDAHTQTRARERMTVHHFARQSQSHAQFAYFVFEQITQRLKQFELHVFRQAADVVVGFDGVGFFGFCACGFDYVRVNRALRQPFGVGEFFLFSVKYFDKFRTDDFAFFLRIGHAGKFRQKLLFGINVNHAYTQVAGKHIHHHFAFVQTQQTVVYKHAGQLVADGAVNQCGRYGRVHAAGQT